MKAAFLYRFVPERNERNEYNHELHKNDLEFMASEKK